MDKAKRAQTAETPKQPSLGLKLRAPYLYPDRTNSAQGAWSAVCRQCAVRFGRDFVSKCGGHGLQIKRHGSIGGEPCQLAQFVAHAVEKAALRAFCHIGSGHGREEAGGHPLDSGGGRATVVDQGGAPRQRCAVKMIEGERTALQLKLKYMYTPFTS